MAFFDELGRRITDVGHSVAESTKGLSEGSRLNSAISTEQKDLTGFYAQLGKAYLAKYKDELDPEFADIVDRINESLLKIDNYQQQIRDNRGVIICENCGAEVPSGNAFCSACGTRMTLTPPVSKPFCPSCGSEITPGSNFCTSCGTKLSE